MTTDELERELADDLKEDARENIAIEGADDDEKRDKSMENIAHSIAKAIKNGEVSLKKVSCDELNAIEDKDDTILYLMSDSGVLAGEPSLSVSEGDIVRWDGKWTLLAGGGDTPSPADVYSKAETDSRINSAVGAEASRASTNEQSLAIAINSLRSSVGGLYNSEVEGVTDETSVTSSTSGRVKTFVVGLATSIKSKIEAAYAHISNMVNTLDDSATHYPTTHAVTAAIGAEATARESADATLQSNIESEATEREQADGELQAQIDAISSKSDVVDVVASYVELVAYDTSALGDNDVIKVLEDETHDDAESYYRWNLTTQTWGYIGSQGPFVTPAEMQTALNGKVDKVTGKGLSTNDYTTTEKNKLAGIETGANKTVVDSALSGTSANPVQNKVVKAALDGKEPTWPAIFRKESLVNSITLKTRLRKEQGKSMFLLKFLGDSYEKGVIDIDVSIYAYTETSRFEKQVNLGSWAPTIYFWGYKSSEESTEEYIAISLVGSIQWPSIRVYCYYGNRYAGASTDGWTFVENAEIPESAHLIPDNGVLIANKLKTARNLKVNLASESAQSFDGSANAESVGVSGTLPITHGGTGATTDIGAEYNLLNHVQSIGAVLDDTRSIALLNQTKSSSNGVFRWLAVTYVWDYIKGKVKSWLGVDSSDKIADAHIASASTWNEKYTKPSGGIPKNDLASTVQNSLGLADTAVQDASYVHTDNNYSTSEKNKLAGIETGAQVNNVFVAVYNGNHNHAGNTPYADINAAYQDGKRLMCWNSASNALRLYTLNGFNATDKIFKFTSCGGSGEDILEVSFAYLEGNINDTECQAKNYLLAKRNHASSDTTYGVGDATKYGHVKVDSALSDTSTNPVQNKVVKAALDGKAPVVDGGYRTIEQDVSKGANLVVNGNGFLGNNYNFSSAQYEGAESFNGSAGHFKIKDSVIRADEFIKVDGNNKYVISADCRSDNGASSNIARLTISCYDIDKNEIAAYHTMYGTGTTTRLAKDLKNGDTKIFLESVSNWSNGIYASYKRGFIFWNYKNSFGTQYDKETYSRHYTWDYTRTAWGGGSSENCWFDDASAIDVEENSISLKSEWKLGAIPAGTWVSRCDSGSNFKYISTKNALTNQWTHLFGSIRGFDFSGTNVEYKFYPATASIKVAWVNSSTYSTSNYFRFTNLLFYEIPLEADALSTPRTIQANLGSTAAASFDGSANVTPGVTGTLPITHGGTGKTNANDAANALINGLPLWSADVTDNTQIIRQDTGGAAQFGRVPGSAMWNYIKGKVNTWLGIGTDDVLPITHGGTGASTAAGARTNLGLGNVENESVSNGTPDFTEAATRTNIATGEKMSVLFGKIKKWFTDLKTVAFTGSYNDLSDKPTIPTGQVQSDWNETGTSEPSFIKNKPQNLVQDASYVHTDNNYSTSEKDKLAGIEAGAQVNNIFVAVYIGAHNNAGNTPYADINAAYQAGKRLLCWNSASNALRLYTLNGFSATDKIFKFTSCGGGGEDILEVSFAYLEGNINNTECRTNNYLLAKRNHASSDTTYGTGSSSNYGHVKLSASTSSTSGVNDGVAATPSAVKSAYDLANGKYSKPSGGVPYSDMSSGVKASLDKADTALQQQDISGKLDKTGDGKDVTVTFTEASTRTDVSSGDTLATLFGKVKKWFSSLGSLAFKSSVADGDISGTISDAHIASASTWNGKADKSHASTTTAYGTGTSSNYGHVKLSDDTNSSSGASDGVAATPLAVQNAYKRIGYAYDAYFAQDSTAVGVELLQLNVVSNNTTGSFLVRISNRNPASGKYGEIVALLSIAQRSGSLHLSFMSLVPRGFNGTVMKTSPFRTPNTYDWHIGYRRYTDGTTTDIYSIYLWAVDQTSSANPVTIPFNEIRLTPLDHPNDSYLVRLSSISSAPTIDDYWNLTYPVTNRSSSGTGSSDRPVFMSPYGDVEQCSFMVNRGSHSTVTLDFTGTLGSDANTWYLT